jgi:NAD(P)H-dependent FMN reductase
MHIVVISGSHRKNSQSGKVARYAASRITALNNTFSAEVLDLAGNPLPLYDGEFKKPDSPTGKVWPGMAEKLQKADGFVVVSPEWHGMVPAGLKNFFLHTSPKEVGHKPALIMGVSASRGGSYPVAELRMSSYKNSRILYLPEHILVQFAEKVLNGEKEESTDDAYIRRRIDYALRILIAYTEAMKPVRESGVTTDPTYPSGM